VPCGRSAWARIRSARSVFGPARVPRPRQRVCLEAGLKLDLNRLVRQGCVAPGACSTFRIVWANNYIGEEVACAQFAAHMISAHEGRLRIQMGDTEQTILLVPRPRRFGGHQWYFICPVMNCSASVLWRPPGATRSCSRRTWGRRAAYASQLLDADNRAHRGKAKIKARLIADLDPDEWGLPPKPKWMRWSTYNWLVDRFDRYEEILDRRVAELMAKLLKK
jgi:hypothetical protein